jgi:D-alanine-D-alanine ligase
MAAWETWSRERVKAQLTRTPIAVLKGGRSDERGVSLTSGGAVVAALRDLTGPSFEVAPPIFEVEIDPSGQWVLDGAALEPLQAIGSLPEEALFLLALHGGEGEDGTVQGFLEAAQRRYTGAGPECSALCMDKHRSREAAAAAGVKVAEGALVTRAAFLEDRAAALARAHAVAGPVRFVKHTSAGSSFGVHRCADDAAVAAACEDVVASGADVLVEAEVRGLETTVGVMGDGRDALALPVAEVVPGEGGLFFDHEQKYSDAHGAQEFCPPRYLPAELTARLQARALEAWESFGGTRYARIDFIVPAERQADGSFHFEQDVDPVLLEANTLPGFTPRSLLPLAAAADGVGFRELCLELVARSL